MAAANLDSRTALHVACAEGHLVHIQIHIKLVHVFLHISTFPQHCVKFLVVSCKLDLKMTDRWGFTPLSEAVRFKHELVVQYLKECIGKSEALPDSSQFSTRL